MRRGRAIWLLAAALLLSGQSSPRHRDALLEGCATLKACLAILDKAPLGPEGAALGDEGAIAANLARFGTPAKDAMMARGAGRDRGRASFADAILEYWPGLDARDVPALTRVLARNRGGWVARVLARIGTPDAVRILADDVKAHGAASQSGWGLSQAGTRALPYLMPMLEDGKKWRDIVQVIVDMDGATVHGAVPGWIALALDSHAPKARRLAALRALNGVAAWGRDEAVPLRPLLNDPDAVLAHAVADCAPTTDAFAAALINAWCLNTVAAYGAKAWPYAPGLADAFLNSSNGVDRAMGAGFLGYIAFAPAVSRLIALLKDPDWRVAYNAARALGWMQVQGARAALEETARDHWLADVREQARIALAGLQPGAAPPPRPPLQHAAGWAARAWLNPASPASPSTCEADRWRWHDTVFGPPGEPVMSIQVAGGRFTGTKKGEWGGALFWSGEPKRPLHHSNVWGMAPSRDGVVVLFGDILSPSYVAAMARDAGGTWRLREIARLPELMGAIAPIGPDLYAAWSGGHVVVVSLKGIEGEAACAAP